MATITDTTTDANGNIIINVSSSADDAITLATAGTYSDKNIIFNITTQQSDVQPDWNQNDPTAPDYVKNRPFYTGYPVETVLVEESTVAFKESYGVYTGKFISPFDVTAGETYKVFWDGTTYECSCVDLNGPLGIGNLSILGAGSDTGEPFFMIVFNGDGMSIVTNDTSAAHTFSISVLRQEVVKVDAKYLPDTVATKSEVEAAKTVAEAAKTVADDAKTAADNLQAATNSSKEALYGGLISSVTFTFDKKTSGRDTFTFNGFSHYKISDFNPAPDDVISFKGTRENGNEWSEVTIGENCVEYGFFIVVASAGSFRLPIGDTVGGSLAPSAGLYARYDEGNSFMTAGTGEFTLRSSTGSLSITGLSLKSSTANSTKKFKITVDDSGTLTATEVTE